MESENSYILYIEQKKLLKAIWQYNKYNKFIKNNGYHMYEVWKKVKHNPDILLLNLSNKKDKE